MSRIGRKVIPIPAGVKLLAEDRTVRAEGPKGKLRLSVAAGIDVAVNDRKEVVVSRAGDSRLARSLHGTTRALIANMIKGVTEGFSRTLQIRGVGYSADVKGRTLSLSVGFVNKIELAIPAGIEVKTDRISIAGENMWQVIVSGPDRQAVGQLAAEIRRVRPPEPYKGKGIRYENERVIQKAGKSFQSGTGS